MTLYPVTLRGAGLAILGAVIVGLGLWLWFRNGVPVWLEGAVAFCL